MTRGRVTSVSCLQGCRACFWPSTTSEQSAGSLQAGGASGFEEATVGGLERKASSCWVGQQQGGLASRKQCNGASPGVGVL